MIFLLSGEGPQDIGVCESGAALCEGADFAPGPMTLLVDQVVECHWDYSILDTGAVRFVSESQLTASAVELKAAKKSIRLPGAKVHKETRYFFNTARLLAKIAQALENSHGDEVIAVLFRDADGTASAERGHWADKWSSMLTGFSEEHFERGVPMIPKPKSEAWLICAFKQHAYQNCTVLEDRSGNDNSPKSLKGELADILDESVTRDLLVRLLAERAVRAEKIDMPSFKAFVARLEVVMGVRVAPDSPK